MPNYSDIITFWFEELTPQQHFQFDPALDTIIRNKFTQTWREAAAGRLATWSQSPTAALALILVLDQFSRNIHRGTAEAFAQDHHALAIAKQAIAQGFDEKHSPEQQAFFYLPFMHQENIEEQKTCVALYNEKLPESENIRFAIDHCAIIQKFGRFPHRNKILQRDSTPEEITFLEQGGFNPA
ncbi:MAG: DUF924 family protein [bacterium]